MQTRMQKGHLPGYVTVLLHGFPGTGKTKSVYQMARETGRDIIRADISASKSMYREEKIRNQIVLYLSVLKSEKY